jgi:hypothetical protein
VTRSEASRIEQLTRIESVMVVVERFFPERMVN